MDSVERTGIEYVTGVSGGGEGGGTEPHIFPASLI